MEPLKLSQAIEDNVVEVFAWLYLFPVTLAELTLRPVSFLDRMQLESEKKEAPRFDARMSPILFMLFGTLPLSIAVIKLDKDGATMPAVADAALVIALCVGLFPFTWTLVALAAMRRGFARSVFRAAFGTQCYLCTPGFALLLLAVLLQYLHKDGLSLGPGFAAFAALLWALITEWRLLVRARAWLTGTAFFALGLALSVGAWHVLTAVAHASGQKWLSS